MVGEARGIGPVNRPSQPNHQPAVDLSVMRRGDLAHRLLDNRLLGSYLLKSPIVQFASQTRNLKNTIIEALSFDYAPLNPIFDASIARVERMLDNEILAKANQQIVDFHKEQRSTLDIPEVAGFFKLSTFGQFDPQQYLLVKTLGAAFTIAEAIRNKGLQVIPPRPLENLTRCFEDGYILLRATEIASRQ